MLQLAIVLRWVIKCFPDNLIIILNQESLSELDDRGLIEWDEEDL